MQYLLRIKKYGEDEFEYLDFATVTQMIAYIENQKLDSLSQYDIYEEKLLKISLEDIEDV